MPEKSEPTYWIKIYASGPIEEAKHVIRKYVKYNPLCVTIEKTTFLYTGGEESGYVVGLINYPRFPSTPQDLWKKAIDLANILRDETFQWSILIMSPDKTTWLSDREEE